MNPLRAAALVAVTLALALALCVACASAAERQGNWTQADVVIPSERVLRQALVIAMQKNGFPPGTEEVGAQETVSSGWKVELQPFKGDGRRRRAHAEYEELGPREWRIYVRVENETNEELAKPLELSRAKWERAPDDSEAASRIVRYLLNSLAEGGALAPVEGQEDGG
ncbi:MAG: hypothetical protein JNK02_05595 [Planctomycetes bacterium]|nr:hypothetical protein [Planctomycetota bacterium]